MVLEDLRAKTGELLDEGLRSGALTPEEHSWRRQHLLRVETLDALETLVEDLMEPPAAPRTSEVALRSASQVTVLSSRNFALADLGSRTELVTILGSTRIDLTGIDPAEELKLELVTILGDTIVEVPLGVKVKVESTPVMGDCLVDPQLRSRDALIRITGAVVMGSLRVVVKK